MNSNIKKWRIVRQRIALSYSVSGSSQKRDLITCRHDNCSHVWQVPCTLDYWNGPVETWNFVAKRYGIDDDIPKAWSIIDDVIKHLEDAHNIVACTYCGRLITQRGMKRHHKGVECRSLQRAWVLEQQGLVEVNANAALLKCAFAEKLKQLVDSVDWQDAETIRALKQQAAEFEQDFLDKLGVKTYVTKLTRDSWEEEHWTDSVTAQFLDLAWNQAEKSAGPGARRIYASYETYTQTVSDWIEQVDKRDAMLGFLELALEDEL